MEYEKDFVKSFVERSLKIADEYNGEYDSTLLLNCLLGLLVGPREKANHRITDVPMADLEAWGIPASSVQGKCQCGGTYPKILMQLTRCLRNAVAHFDIKPIHSNGRVSGFVFEDEKQPFKAELTIEQLRTFVGKLAQHMFPPASPRS